MGFLALTLPLAGAAALGAMGEGDGGRAGTLAAIAAIVAAALLATQAAVSSRLGPGDRLVALGLAAGSPLLLGLLAFLFGAANIIVGDWGPAAGACAVMGGSAAAGAIAVAIHRRTRIRVLPPFQPLRPEVFERDPDPPAYAPPPPEPRDIRPRGGLLDRLLRALWLRR